MKRVGGGGRKEEISSCCISVISSVVCSRSFGRSVVFCYPRVGLFSLLCFVRRPYVACEVVIPLSYRFCLSSRLALSGDLLALSAIVPTSCRAAVVALTRLCDDPMPLP